MLTVPALAAVRTVEQETKIVDGFIEAVKGNKELAADQAQKAVDAAAAVSGINRDADVDKTWILELSTSSFDKSL